MKKILAIFLLLAVLIGTVNRDVCGSKAIKTIVMSDKDADDKDADDGSDGDSKDLLEKDKAESFFHQYDLSFKSHVSYTAFSFISSRYRDFDHPYLECISEPPEFLS
jgi:hypothetical protein